MSLPVCGKAAAHVEYVGERTGGLEEGGQNKESWMFETGRKLEAGRRLKRTDGDRYKQVENRRRRREETGKKKRMVAVEEEEIKTVGQPCILTHILMMGKVLLVFLHQWENILKNLLCGDERVFFLI